MDREWAAKKIAQDPYNYMVCCACKSILVRRMAATCPLCHAYGFDYREEAVVDTALQLGKNKDTTIPWL